MWRITPSKRKARKGVRLCSSTTGDLTKPVTSASVGGRQPVGTHVTLIGSVTVSPYPFVNSVDPGLNLNAAQIGLIEFVKGSKVTKPMAGHFAKSDTPPVKEIREGVMHQEFESIDLNSIGM